MTHFRFGLSIAAAALVATIATHASAAVIFVTDNVGNVWKYDNIADMSGQTSSTITGTKVRNAAVHGNQYATDQDATMALNTGIIYRITGTGNVIQYPTVRDYIHNTNATVAATAVYSEPKKVNGLSYDGSTSGFYAVPASGSTFNSATGGDIIQFGTGSGGPVVRFLAANNNGGQTLTTANYTGAVLNFYDPDTTSGTTVGPTPTPHAINARYYQVASNGRLEGFDSLAEYNTSSNNRINITGLNAFGGTSSFQAIAAFAVPLNLASIPEATSALIWFGIVVGTAMIRRR